MYTYVIPLGMTYVTRFTKRYLLWTQLQCSLFNITQWIVCTIAKIQQSAFTEASFFTLPDVCKYLGGLQIVKSCLDRYTADRESQNDRLVRLGMDLATFCDDYVELKKAKIDAI